MSIFAIILEHISFLLLAVDYKVMDRKKFIQSVIYVMFTVMLVVLCNKFNVPITIRCISVVILGTVFQIIIFKYSFKYSLFIATLYISLLFMCDSIAMSFISVVKKESALILLLDENVLFTTTYLSKTLLIIFSLLAHKANTKINKTFKYTNFMVIMIPHIISLLILFIISGQIFSGRNYSVKYSIILLITSVFITISTICNALLTEYYVNAREIEHETELDIKQMETLYNCYRVMKDDMENVQSLYHDIKNHILILEKTAESGRHDKYIHNIKCKIRNFESHFNTGNEFLDVALHKKYMIAREKGIRLEANINIIPINFICDIDLCTIFVNAIDNAIEECEVMDAKADKCIMIRHKEKDKFYYISFKNSIEPGVGMKIEERIETSKGDKKNHGFGLRNIKKALKQYNGDFTIKVDEDSFYLFIIIPLS